MAKEKMTLNAWINSQLKNKGWSVSKAKKNAGKYKSISAAKKAGSLYYTNKDGKVMIAAYAEDLKMPLKRPDSMKKKEIGKNINKKAFPAVDTSKITKKDLPPVKGDAKKRIKEADKKSMDKYNYLFENHETIFKMAMTDKFDSNRLQFMLNMAKKVQLNEISRHDADVEVGTELVNNIVKPQLEKSE